MTAPDRPDLEKRAIALDVPVWKPEICIQCNFCVMICPHAAIQAKVFTPEALAGAPEGFRAEPVSFERGMDHLRYAVQVAPEDCTGCGLCVEVCPAKDRLKPQRKALVDEPLAPHRAREREAFAFFEQVPSAPLEALKLDKRSAVLMFVPGVVLHISRGVRWDSDHVVTLTDDLQAIAQEIVWEKQNGSSFHADRFKRVHELAVQFYPTETPWRDIYNDVQTTPDATARTARRKQRPPHTGRIDAGHYVSHDGGPRLMRSVIYVRNCHGTAIHPTEKPSGLIEILIRASCPHGGLVGDWFAGSGAAGEACRLAGRRYLGCEIDADSTMFSELEKPAPSIRFPVGRSLTVKFTSTWSVVPGIAGVSTVTSSKKPRRSSRVAYSAGLRTVKRWTKPSSSSQ